MKTWLGGGRKIDIARAVAWAAGELAPEVTDSETTHLVRVLDDLLREYPYDPVLQVRKAALLENTGDRNGAYALLEEVQAKNPSFMVLLRMLTLTEISETDFNRQSEQFIQLLEPVTVVSPHQLRVEKAQVMEHFVDFSGPGTTTATIELNDRGSYLLTVIARGEQVMGKWPVLKISVDGDLTDMAYICRENWDGYNISLPLEAGMHTIELAYEEEDSDTTGEKRQLQLRSLYLTQAGVAYVR